jgi:hypothetical protein
MTYQTDCTLPEESLEQIAAAEIKGSQKIPSDIQPSLHLGENDPRAPTPIIPLRTLGYDRIVSRRIKPYPPGQAASPH